jgi:hypothetical protein
MTTVDPGNAACLVRASINDALRSMYDVLICDDQAIGTDDCPSSKYLVGDQVPCLVTVVVRGLDLDPFYLDLHRGRIHARNQLLNLQRICHGDAVVRLADSSSRE